ncbi:translation initiation factor IF-2-like [Portunus trituberculatus]|uniref:translation initiation factor IF-2-like n=1 Tax=Portunus trituberculatus TaxID=210409 RepID=UPI001E1D09A7|nr:translation initiation factor IF-2-like [Portunus trituberculatus]
MLWTGSPRPLHPDDDRTALHPPSPTPSPEDAPQCGDASPHQAPPQQPAAAANTLPRPASRRRSSDGRHSLCTSPEDAARWGGWAGGGARPRDLWGAAPLQNHWALPAQRDAEDGHRGEGEALVMHECRQDVSEPDEAEGRSENQLLAPTPADSVPTGLDNPALEHTDEACTPPPPTPQLHAPAARSTWPTHGPPLCSPAAPAPPWWAATPC